MSTLYLIRHGQAGFAQAEYDILSDLGGTQARHLGSYSVAAQLRIDALYCAPRRRHRETAQHMRAAAEQAGGSLPVLEPAADFDEFPFAEIVRVACESGLAAEYAALASALGGGNPLADAKAFGRLFRLSMQRWANDEVTVSESFVSFTQRVVGGLQRIMAAQGQGRRVAVVTSAGAIAAVLRHVLGLTPEMMLELCLHLFNTGISELRFRGDKVSVVSFNTAPHLLSPELRTFR